ncbi:DUF1187 family protein [Escherichia coli]|uniref:DUF1187 family protein n=1 Tax=Escherichia coli TaxID=562 RepID=UPI002B2ACCAA|nr:DUF1187 family protein [Escherichia coli]BEC99484.1 hypothetical protein VEE64_25600 [Escherichia coli]
MYKITATIEKEGGTPTNWTRYSKSKLTKSEYEKMLSGKKEAGVSREQKVKLGNDSNLLIVFYVQIMPDDFVMQLHRF